MVYVYAIKSKERNYIYVGMTGNVERRVTQHQNGYETTTKAYRPFTLIYTEEFEDRISARKREKYLKTAAGKRFLRSLL
jgi:putative endonuclease